MTDSTKEKALEKLDAITVKIGYPDKWEDYSSLQITADNFYQNIQNVKKFNFKKTIERIGKDHDKTRWGMTPQTVNAYYSPNSNEIVFPAAILQPPFFYENADDAVNYGAIGVVIGHEMTHGFDDQGRNYDKEGNLNNWWTETDAKAFEKTLDNIKNNYSNYVELDSLHVDGELTLGENIADLGGLNISWDAFMTTEQAKKNDTIDGFTAKQRFYLSYSKVWRQNILPEELMKRLKEDVHSPGDARVNIALFNLNEFYNHFNIKENDPLFLAPDKRAIIW
jgi:putative endopeptidase